MRNGASAGAVLSPTGDGGGGGWWGWHGFGVWLLFFGRLDSPREENKRRKNIYFGYSRPGAMSTSTVSTFCRYVCVCVCVSVSGVFQGAEGSVSGPE